MTPLQHHELARPDATIRYWTGGPVEATTVVFLHGATLDHHAWAPQSDALQDRFQVVVPDLRAHGTSTGRFDYEAAVQDVLALLDQLPAERVVLVGLSLGGNIAQEVVRRDPHRVLALVAADTTCNTADRHPMAASISVAALSTQAILAGNGFAREAARTTARDPRGPAVRPRGQRPPVQPGDPADPGRTAHQRAAARTRLPPADPHTARPRAARPCRRHRRQHPGMGAARAIGPVRRHPERGARQQPRRSRHLHRDPRGVPRPGAPAECRRQAAAGRGPRREAVPTLWGSALALVTRADARALPRPRRRRNRRPRATSCSRRRADRPGHSSSPTAAAPVTIPIP